MNTKYNPSEIEDKIYKEWVCSSVEKRSENCVRVSMCLYECLKHHLGHNDKNYGYSITYTL